MSISFGGSKSKSSSTSNSTSASNFNQTQTSTPNIPTWLQNQTTGQSANIAKLASADPFGYVAKANGMQTGAAAATTAMAGDKIAAPAFDKFGGWGGDMTRAAAMAAPPTVQSASLLDGLSNYYNPFQSQVIDASAADFDHNAAMQHAQRTLDEANSGAFQGSGAALATTMGDDNSDRARASLLSGLRSQGFDAATALSGQDAQRRQDASSANAQLAAQQQALKMQGAAQLDKINTDYAGTQLATQTADQANQRANLAAMFDQGSQLHALDQQQATAPLDLQAWANSQFGTIPANLFVGNTTDASGASTGTASGTSTGKQSGFNFGASASIPY